MRRIMMYGQMCLYAQVYRFVLQFEVVARLIILSRAIPIPS